MHWPPGAPGLLRRQIGQRSDDLAVGVNSGRISATDVASAKSTRHGIPSAGQPDVGRGDVAVHHGEPVHPGHGPRRRQREPDQDFGRQRRHQCCRAKETAAFDLPSDELHHHGDSDVAIDRA